jgi:DNA-binding NarL/FixJ family response regulator
MTQEIRVLCVDDHQVVREGLAAMINRQVDMRVVGEATNGLEGLRLYRDLAPDVTLMDLQLPVMSGLDSIKAIRQFDTQARIVVLTMYQGDEDILRCLEEGAATYLVKDELAEALVTVVREVFAGKKPIPPRVAQVLASRPDEPRLSQRETEVLSLVARGWRNKEVADSLKISEETAKVHMKNLMAKLRAKDRTEAVHIALRRGILHVPPGP